MWALELGLTADLWSLTVVRAEGDGRANEDSGDGGRSAEVEFEVVGLVVGRGGRVLMTQVLRRYVRTGRAISM